MGETLPPLRIRENDGVPNLIPVYDIILSNNLTLASKGPGIVVISATTGAGGTSQEPITFPLIVGSGGSGVTTIGSNQIVLGSGTAPFVAFVALNSGELIAGSSTVVKPQVLGAGSQGQVLIANSSLRLGMAWIDSNALGSASSVVYAQTGDTFLVYSASTGLTSERVIAASDNITIVSSGTSFLISAITNAAGGGTQVVSIPMALLTIEVNSGNAFWTASTDTTRMDRAYINMIDSGRSVSTWWCFMPRNLNATPAWGVDVYSEAAALGSTGGFLVLNVDGMSVAVGESSNTLAASTVQLISATSFQLNTSGILSVTTFTATNFDGVLTTSATDYLKIKIARQGNADTLNSDWWIYNVTLNCTVDT